MSSSSRRTRALQHRRKRRFVVVTVSAATLLLLLLLLMLLLLGPTVCAPPPTPAAFDLCALFKERPSWYLSTRQAAERWAVEEAVLIAVIEQESSFRARARPPRRKLLGFIPWRRPSSAFGYAQALDGTWEQYQQERGAPAARHRFGDAIDFVGWYLSGLSSQLGLSSDDVGHLYLAYHEGPGGYRRGSYRAKPWLLDVADRLDRRVDHYRVQLEKCRGSLERRLLLRRLWFAATLLGAGALILLGLRWRRTVSRPR